MSNETSRGRAQLRDLSPAEGVYEVDYIIHSNIKKSKHIGLAPTTHKVLSADIRPVNGYTLKNGVYALEEEDGRTLCKLRKTGALWQIVTED